MVFFAIKKVDFSTTSTGERINIQEYFLCHNGKTTKDAFLSVENWNAKPLTNIIEFRDTPFRIQRYVSAESAQEKIDQLKATKFPNGTFHVIELV